MTGFFCRVLKNSIGKNVCIFVLLSLIKISKKKNDLSILSIIYLIHPVILHMNIEILNIANGYNM